MDTDDEEDEDQDTSGAAGETAGGGGDRDGGGGRGDDRDGGGSAIPQPGNVELVPHMPRPQCDGRFCGPFIALEQDGQCIVQELGMPNPSTCLVPFNNNTINSTKLHPKFDGLMYQWQRPVIQ